MSICSSVDGQIEYYHFDSRKAEKLMFSAINRVRLENKLPILKSNQDLNRMAGLHARDMIQRDFFDHVNPDGDDPRARAQKIGIRFPVSENLGILSSFGLSLDEVVTELLKSLLESPEHRANLLNPNLTEIGLAFAQDKDQKTSIIDIKKIGDSKLGYGTVVVCQDFMKRGLKSLNPDPFPSSVEKGDNIVISGETYRDFDTVMIEIEESETHKMIRKTEIALFGRTFEERVHFFKNGNFTLKISGNSYKDERTYLTEELIAIDISVSSGKQDLINGSQQ
jgi:hypothetical protein